MNIGDKVRHKFIKGDLIVKKIHGSVVTLENPEKLVRTLHGWKPKVYVCKIQNINNL